MATLKKSKVKKAEYGVKAPVDSTGYFQGRIKKADQLLSAAEKEGMGKSYTQPFQDNYGKALKESVAYQKRKSAADTTKSVAPLKKGGKVPCAGCGAKMSKKKK